MLCANCSTELGKAGKKRRRREEDKATRVTPTDRLTYLPEPILYHIFSFLDTKSAVQTSVLSRPWRCVWKYAPVLDLRCGSFSKVSSFRDFVANVLYFRYNLIKLHKVSYVHNTGTWGATQEKLLRRVIEYSLSHEVRHLVVDSGNNKCAHHHATRTLSSCKFSYLFKSVSICSGLETLEVGHIALDRGFVACTISRRFPTLTTLKLVRCMFDTKNPEHSLDFPCLKKLAMSDCVLPAKSTVLMMLKVNGPELVALELNRMGKFKIEVFALKLKLFSVRLVGKSQRYLKFSSSSTLTDLDRADIAFTRMPRQLAGKVLEHEYLNSLFQDLHNAKSLKIDSSTFQVLKELMDQQVSPFKRLKTLIVPFKVVPYRIMKSLFNCSRNEKPLKMKQYTIKVLGNDCRVSLDELRPLISSSKAAKWDKVVDYIFKKSFCEEPNILVEVSKSSLVRRKRKAKILVNTDPLLGAIELDRARMSVEQS